jgi:hypothetical protein
VPTPHLTMQISQTQSNITILHLQLSILIA